MAHNSGISCSMVAYVVTDYLETPVIYTQVTHVLIYLWFSVVIKLELAFNYTGQCYRWLLS